MSETLIESSFDLMDISIDGYILDGAALAARFKSLKDKPTPMMLAWLKAHPEFPEFNIWAHVAYSGLSEATIKKIKSGTVTDLKGCTFWVLYVKYDIKPREFLRCLPAIQCNLECANQARHKLDAAIITIEKLETQLASSRAEIKDLTAQLVSASNSASNTQQRVEAMERAITRRDAGIKMRNRLVFILAALIISLLVIAVIK